MKRYILLIALAGLLTAAPHPELSVTCSPCVFSGTGFKMHDQVSVDVYGDSGLAYWFHTTVYKGGVFVFPDSYNLPAGSYTAIASVNGKPVATAFFTIS